MKKMKHLSGLVLALCLVLSLLPAPAYAAPHPFTDVPAAAWYAGAVQYAYENDLVSGTAADKFSPDLPISRGMIVTLLHRLEGLPSASGITFEDVPAGQWCESGVSWASANGIVAGYGNGKFGPDDTITHQQLAAILYRYAGYKGYDTEPAGGLALLPDGEKVSSYAIDPVKWAAGFGLYQDVSEAFSMTGGATRAQATSVLTRFREDVALAPSYALTVVSAMDIMCEPSGIFFQNDGSFLVTDTYNKLIWRVADNSSTIYAGVSKVYAGGSTVTDPYDRPIGGYNDAALENSYFKLPWAIAPFLDGYAVSDADNNVVRLVRAKNTQTLNGSTTENLTVTDLGVAFDHPTGLASDEEGNLYISDTYKGAVRKLTPDGTVTTVAKDLSDPTGLCWKNGVLYIAETGANRIVKLMNGRVVVAAGNGEDGFEDGLALDAAFSAPQGVAVGDDGTLYISDTVNGAVRQVKGGLVSTLVHRDVTDLSAFIPVSPVGLTLHGNRLYVCDSFARKVFIISLGR